jgi:nitrogen regulatory protein P-II 1
MKKIEAIMRKDKFDEVFRALESSGVGGMTMTPSQGFGQHHNGLKDSVKVEVYCDEFQVDSIVETICKAANTGFTGDGKIAILELSDIRRIRTGEDGAGAI